jgi:hypothetical protein
MLMNIRIILAAIALMLSSVVTAQELNCKVKILHSQVQGTNTSVFETLETALNEFMNNRSWTELQFSEVERIECTFNITIKTYDVEENRFTGELLFQSSRPVFNSAYNTTVFSMKDNDFSFTYKEFDQLDFNENMLDNNLTAMLAYYAYLIIGMDLDTMSPLGGTDILRKAELVVNNAQSMSEPGWKTFDDPKNRHGIINDYLESSMEPFRQLQYKYHREGLDEMSNNVDRGRNAITEAIAMLNEAHKNKPLSMLPQIFTDYKRDEIVNIYSGHGTAKEKEEVYNILSELNASQNRQWQKIKK